MASRLLSGLALSALLMIVGGACLAQQASESGTAAVAGAQAVARPAQSADAIVAPIKRRKPARASGPASRPAAATRSARVAKSAGKKARVKTTAAQAPVKK